MGGDGHSRDGDRDAILARRAKFLATAMAGLSVATTACESEPQACLNISVPQTAQPEADAAPTATASGAPIATAPQPQTRAADAGIADAATTDAGSASDAGVDASAGDGGVKDAGAARDAGKAPVPLKPPRPKPCLMVLPD